uniref:Rho-GAP domain-containing protein n=1 Tax=Syphacia muris TaxID=451379 RepID=A0A0N5AZA3_9BILA
MFVTTEVRNRQMSSHMFSLDESMLEGIKSIKVCHHAPNPPVTNLPISLTASLVLVFVRLKTVASYVLELEVELGDRQFKSIKLSEVPSFLLEAFRDLRSRGMEVEGLFRKEGNWNRLKNVSSVYFGCVGIPKDCTVHDICSMIKRFFREIKTPLFAHLEPELVNIASEWEGEQRRIRLLDTILMLPPNHLGTLSYLLRQLKYFGDHHEGHHMTIENLSKVFAPTLFRDGSVYNAGKKKKRSSQQKPAFSTMRSDTELKIAIVTELIENAAKVGIKQDNYGVSRRPSDINFSKNHRRYTLQNNSSLRSSSAKPFSRNPFSKPGSLVCGDNKDKKIDRLKCKNREGRRSSSTVRDIFSSFSTKVLRRAASPGRLLLNKRTSAEVIIDEKSVENTINSRNGISSGNPDVLVTDLSEKKGDIRLNNEEEQSKIITFENEENIFEEKIRDLKSKGSSLALTNVENVTVSTQRRSRRESPCKHITANSRIKPINSSIVGVNWWPASPAFESPQISVKCLDVVKKRTSSTEVMKEEQQENVLVHKPTKSNKEDLDLNHIALSFLENYEKNRSDSERRRRHTAPLKFSSVLKRNQPNTIGTGLRNVPVRIRESSHRNDKMKRRSESLGGESSDCSQASADDDNETNCIQLIDSSTILEQKNIECRQRRAKRKKRKEKVVGANEERLYSPNLTPCSPTVSLLDDVTNEIERLEKQRQEKNEDSVDCSGILEVQPSTIINDIFPVVRTESSCSKKDDIRTSSNSVANNIIQPLNKNVQCNSSSTTDRNGVVAENCNETFKVPFLHKGKPKSNSKGLRCRSNIVSVSEEEINDETFAYSDMYKKQILTNNGGNIMKQCCGSARPSVAYIKNNNRGMVKERVNQFARLESQNLTDSFFSKSLCNSGSCEFMKPSAPPVTHGLRPAERRLTMSPPSNCSSASRTKLSDASTSSPSFSSQLDATSLANSPQSLKSVKASAYSASGSAIFTPIARRRVKY